MAMPETVELQIHDCGTMDQCIAQAKQCLAICQPTSLIGKVSSLTIAQSSPPLTQDLQDLFKISISTT